MRSIVKVVAVLLGLSLALASCSIGNSNEQRATLGANKAQRLYNDNRVKVPGSLVAKEDSLFISDRSVKVDRTVALPPSFKKTLLYTAPSAEDLNVTVSHIAKLTGQSISLDNGVSDDRAAAIESGAVSTYQGSFSQVLDQICNKYNLYWEYKNGVVSIFALVTKMYELDAPVGSFNLINNVSSISGVGGAGGGGGGMGGAGGGGGVGGNASMMLNYEVEGISPWEAAENTIKTMLSSEGKYSANPIEGYITITDTPKVQKNIETYILKINSRTNKKIAVRVDVYNVETSATSDFGMQMDAVISALSNEVEVTNSLSGFLNADNTGAMTEFNFTGSGDTHNIVLSALNTIGKASEVTGTTIYTVSGQPAPVQSTESQNYLEEVTTEVTEGISTTSSETGTVVTGYSMTVTPRILSNGQVLVNLDLQISSLVEIQNFAISGDENSDIIQLPKTKNKNFLENMVLHNGQSILIAGFQDDFASSDTASPTAIDLWQAGGAKTTRRSKSTTVIVVTPYIIGG